MNRKQMTAERALLQERIAFLDACLVSTEKKRSVLDFTDLTACKNKVRQPYYWHLGTIIADDGIPTPYLTRIDNAMSTGCKYDRRLVDPACAACKEIAA